jgi:hypothetical protein
MRMVEVFKDSPVDMLVKVWFDTSRQGLDIYLKGNTDYLNVKSREDSKSEA